MTGHSSATPKYPFVIGCHLETALAPARIFPCHDPQRRFLARPDRSILERGVVQSHAARRRLNPRLSALCRRAHHFFESPSLLQLPDRVPPAAFSASRSHRVIASARGHPIPPCLRTAAAIDKSFARPPHADAPWPSPCSIAVSIQSVLLCSDYLDLLRLRKTNIALVQSSGCTPTPLSPFLSKQHYPSNSRWPS